MPYRPCPRSRPPGLARLACAATLLAAPLSGAHAQWVGGLGEDALVLPRGMVRVSVQGRVESYGDRYSSTAAGDPSSARVPFASELSLAEVGAEALPALAGLQTQLRALSGLSTLAVSLGELRVRADARRSSVPVRIEVGIGRRLQLGVMVPYVQTRTSVFLAGDATATQGNLGPNPALADGAAAAANEALLTQLRTAVGELRAQLAGCATNPGAPACARRVEAEQLATTAESFATGVAEVYGAGDQAGSAFVPVQASAAATAIVERIATFRAGFQGYGVNAIPSGAAPRGAAGPPPPEGLRSALGGGVLAPGLGPLSEVSRYGLGDIEVGARLRILDPFGGDPRTAAPDRGLLVRASVGALLRVGTGEKDEPTHLLDLGTGDGQHDVEVQAAADLLAGNRMSASLAARYGVQLPDELDRLVPTRAGEAYVPAENVMRVRRDLGDYAELELTPRYAITDYVAVGAHYRFRAKGADRYGRAFEPAAAEDPMVAVPDPALLGVGTRTREHFAGVGVVMSTLPAYARGRVRTPLEVSYRHTRTVAGAGQLAPHGTRDEVTLRVYTDLFGGRRR